MKILILGHNGMLGNMVYKYFQEIYEVYTTNFRWDSPEFKRYCTETELEFIINCIGAIPQKKYKEDDYKKINIDLPVFLESTGKKILHPSTDCEFSGFIEYPQKYKKNDKKDALDDYGKSKARIVQIIENEFKNTKIIRTSIIGHEMENHFSLLEWFLNSENKVMGFENHYWNGVTTLFWAQTAEKILNDWDNSEKITQIGTEGLNKYELLKLIAKVYQKNIIIDPFKPDIGINKMLETDYIIPSLEEQLYNLKKIL